MRRSCIYAFDLDGTLLRGNSSIGFYKYALGRRLFSYKTLPSCCLFFLRFRFFFLDLPSFYSRIVSSLLTTVSFEELSSIAVEFAHTLNEKDFYYPALEKFHEALEDSSGEVMIFSSSPDFIVRPIAEILGANMCYASGFQEFSRGQMLANQCLTGDNKAKILSHLKKIGRARSHTFSDHIFDLPFLLLGEEKTVVRPKGRLRKMARKYYWNII
ncbi:HAD-IB family phosphatase [Chlamydia crocodili]|uniref:HAD-IB family phosphatase n=1 Tax=Chlamydia crocodili TaxID=2766982 RepID=A0ABX8CIH8_9CHLA|nr:HAD-IB family phosphatase [Chlamydia crocodili]QVE49382.1 HAD-IB family phosphatase [Chlamydia crocodili]